MIQDDTRQRAIDALVARGASTEDAARTLETLRAAGLSLADDARDELVVRWVDTTLRPVPPEADTIIRTITRTVDGQSSSATHWLEGLRSPHPPHLRT